METVPDVFRRLARHPMRDLLLRWNWKSAVTSALFRGVIFFTANLAAGLDAAMAAFITELGFRMCTSGFYGALTEAFRRATPPHLAMITVLLLLPTISHSLELVVHWWRGTVMLGASIAASVAFTVLSTAFTLFIMRRGVMIVGEGRQSLAADLRQFPALVGAFIVAVARGACRL